MNASLSTTPSPDENMFNTRNIYNIGNPHAKKMTKYENKFTLDIFLKYLFIFSTILTADLIFAGENNTKGKAIK